MSFKGTKPVTGQLFHTVIAQLKGSASLEDIAKVNGIKLSTVKSIRRAGTFERYQQKKAAAAVVAARKRVEAKKAKTTKIEVKAPRTKAKTIKVSSGAEKALDKVVSKPANQIRRATDPIVVTEAMWNNHEAELATVHYRIDAVDTRINSLIGKFKQLTAHKKSLLPWSKR